MPRSRSDARITSLFTRLGFLSRVSSARFSKSSHTTTSISAGGSGDDDDSSKVTSTSNGSNAEEYHRFKVSHFIESVMKIIDVMDNFERRKINTLKASSLAAAETTSSIANNYISLGVDLSQSIEKEDIIATYLKWIDLWKKYLDEQALN
jgi:hypothetical protein